MASARSRILQLAACTALLIVSLLVAGAPEGSQASERPRELLRTACAQEGKERCLRKKVVDRRPFGPGSIWSDRLSADERLSSLSDAYVGRLNAAVASHGAWVNTTEWSTPVYTVGRRQASLPVVLDQQAPDPELERALTATPIPPHANPTTDSDAHLVVWQPSTDTMWELWGARRAADGWHARHGGRMTVVSKSAGYFPTAPGWGATATGLPMLGGLIRISELRAGLIPHALAIGIPEPRAGTYAWPAQRTDGTSPDPLAIPEGTRFRIDPSVDLSKLRMSPFVRTLARAAQRYGIYVTDRAGTVSFEAEDPTPRGSDPYWPDSGGFFEGRYPSELLEEFPWSELQAVAADVRSDGG